MLFITHTYVCMCARGSPHITIGTFIGKKQYRIPAQRVLMSRANFMLPSFLFNYALRWGNLSRMSTYVFECLGVFV